jgi:zinc protease
VSRSLPSGFRFLLSEGRQLPLVTGWLLFRAGSQYESASRVGLAELTIRLMRHGGIAGMTGREIDDKLASIGARIEPGVSQVHSWMAFECPAESIDEVLRLVHEMATAPSLSVDAFDAVETEMRGQIGGRNQDASGIVSRELLKAIAPPASGLGRVLEYEHLERIERDDVRNWARTHLFPSNAILAIQGDFTAADATAKIERLFGTWKAAGEPPSALPTLADAKSAGLLHAQISDRDRAYFAVGCLVSPKAVNLAAADVMAELVQHYLSQWLRGAATTRQFWLQTVQVRLQPLSPQGSLFLIRGTSSPGAVTEGLRELFGQLDRMAQLEPPSGAVEDAKRRVLNRLVLDNERPSTLLWRVAAATLESEPGAAVSARQAALSAVTPADVVKAFRDVVRLHVMTVMVAGNSVLFNAPLSELKLPVSTIDLTIPTPKTLMARTDPESIEQGKAWLRRMQDAMGGAEKLAAIRDFTSEFEGTMTAGNRMVPIKAKEVWLAEETFRQEQTLPDRRLLLFYNGSIGWFSDGVRIGALPSGLVRQIRGELFRLPFRLALSDRIKGRTVSYQGSGVLFVSEGEESVRIYLDEQTALPRRLVYLNITADGSAIPAEQSLGDWRESDGIRAPWNIVVRNGGVKILEQTAASVRFNSGVKLEEVEKKP